MSISDLLDPNLESQIHSKEARTRTLLTVIVPRVKPLTVVELEAWERNICGRALDTMLSDRFCNAVWFDIPMCLCWQLHEELKYEQEALFETANETPEFLKSFLGQGVWSSLFVKHPPRTWNIGLGYSEKVRSNLWTAASCELDNGKDDAKSGHCQGIAESEDILCQGFPCESHIR
ncbi:hypothetical protein B0H34DRAFT_674480 [Crassisporium funariophilum]|nr:hypothetical protein B0H34DRAFT_674480 [Crassisporium funariophilum]